MDKAIRLKKGKMGVNVKQCDSKGRVRIVQDVPFPAEVLNIIGRVSIGDEAKSAIFAEAKSAAFLLCSGIFFIASPALDFIVSPADDFLVTANG
jgi:hypothetical protein